MNVEIIELSNFLEVQQKTFDCILRTIRRNPNKKVVLIDAFGDLNIAELREKLIQKQPPDESTKLLKAVVYIKCISGIKAVLEALSELESSNEIAMVQLVVIYQMNKFYLRSVIEDRSLKKVYFQALLQINRMCSQNDIKFVISNDEYVSILQLYYK